MRYSKFSVHKDTGTKMDKHHDKHTKNLLQAPQFVNNVKYKI